MMDGFHCSTIHQLNQLCYKADLVGLQHLLLVFKNLPCLQERASKMKVDELRNHLELSPNDFSAVRLCN